ncbi:MAG TPA: exosortase-associated EpsI family protein [Gemmataceae bacterium]|nr:exosortase-associated EpsI family protein [Gemmataceae bacterium]
MKRTVVTAVAITAVLATGIVHGIWTGRWEVTDEPGASVARLPNVSMELGDWQGQTLDAESQQLGDASGCLLRRYTNKFTGANVTVFLLCGRPGPVAIHPPDSCYAAGGFEVLTPSLFKAPAEAGATAAEFRVARMRKKRVGEQSQLRVFWSWNDGNSWRVPASPRWTFASAPVLFKLYLVRELPDFEEPLDDDPAIDLVRKLLPELEKVLFSRS